MSTHSIGNPLQIAKGINAPSGDPQGPTCPCCCCSCLSILTPFIHLLPRFSFLMVPALSSSLRPPSVSASYSIYFSIHPSCGYSTQLCSRQTIWCTLLMTDPTWPRRRLAATTGCVCMCVFLYVYFVYVCEYVCENRCMLTDDATLCAALTTEAGVLVAGTLTYCFDSCSHL